MIKSKQMQLKIMNGPKLAKCLYEDHDLAAIKKIREKRERELSFKQLVGQKINRIKDEHTMLRETNEELEARSLRIGKKYNPIQIPKTPTSEDVMDEILQYVYQMMENPKCKIRPFLGDNSREYGWKLLYHGKE